MNAHSEMQRQSARRSRIAGPRLSVLAAAILAACSTGALANPSGATVVGGSASIAQNGSTLTVTNSPGAILNWQSFSIGSGETTHFAQQDAGSAVLNRVVGPLGGAAAPTEILGTLSSNGRVFLINPNGILFGQDARIDVAGLVASTLNLSDQDFLANRLNFTGGGTAGVRNEGRITTTDGGSVYLVGSSVANTGTISAAGGSVTLAAGKTVRLGDTASPNVLVELDADSERVTNLGTVSAAGGEINIYAGVIDQRGVVQANSVGLDAAGRIRFFARHDVGLAAGSATGASGTHGGDVSIDSANGTVMVEGTVSATGSTGSGGRIELTGEQVGVTGAARVDASGETGGGEILLGGDYRGANPEVHNARAVYFGADASLAADAATSGDGGRIILWSDEATRAYGGLSARGGSEAGNGGFVETSSKGYLDVTRTADVTAANGLGGIWLLDPGNLTVQAGPGTLDTSTPNFTAVDGASTVNNAVINAALDAGTSVVLDTGIAATGAGDLTVNAPITKSAGAQATLTMTADNNIVVNSLISDTSGNGLNVNMSAARTTSTGTITLFGGLNTGSGNFSASAPSVQFFNPGYSVGGSFNVGGNFSMGSNANLILGGALNTVSGNMLLDPNAGGGLSIASTVPGTARTLEIGGTLDLADADLGGAGLITFTDLNLTGPSISVPLPIASVTVGTHNVVLNNSSINANAFTIGNGSLTLNASSLNAASFTMSGGSLGGSGGGLSVGSNFAHTAGTIDFGRSVGSFISISQSGPSLTLAQPLNAERISLTVPTGRIVDAVGVGTLNATTVELVSCSSCGSVDQGGIGTLANPLRLFNVAELTASVGGFSSPQQTGHLFIDNTAAGNTLWLGATNGFNQDGAIVNRTPGGSVNITSNGDLTLFDYCPDGCFANVRTQGGAVTLTSTAGSVGNGSQQGLIDTTPFPVTLAPSAAGGAVTLDAATDVNLFAISTAASLGDQAAGGAGANGGDVTITAGGGVDVINIVTRGADGETGVGGAGGDIAITAGIFAGAAGDLVPLSDPTSFLSTAVPNGGFVTSGGAGGASGTLGFSGGNAGNVTISVTNAPATDGIFVGRIEARGGDGGSGVTTGSTAGNGGNGGTVQLTVSAGAGGFAESLPVWDGNFTTPAFAAPSIDTSGGNGGNGDLASGSGGNAGNATLINGGASTLEYAWTTTLAGGNGGTLGTPGSGGTGGTLNVQSASTLTIGSALAEVSSVMIDTRGGTGPTAGTAGLVTLRGDNGITQLDPLILPNAATKLSLNTVNGSIDLLLANQFANVEGGISGTGNWTMRGTQSYTIGNVTVAAGNADFQVDPGASVPSSITFAGALSANGDVTVRFDEPRFQLGGSIASGTGAANFIAFLPNAGVGPISINNFDSIAFQGLTTPTFRMGDATTVTDLDFANTIAAQFLNVGTLSIQTTGTVTQSGTGGVQVQGGAGALQVSASSVNLGASSNAFTTLAGNASSTFSVGQNGNIVLGTVDGVTGITAPTQVRLESFNGDIDVTATGLSSASVLYHTPGTGIARLGGTLGGNQTVFHDFVWTGGALSSGSFLTTATGVSGSLSGAIALDGTFASDGPLSVSATLSGAGLFANNGALTLTNASFGGVQLVNTTSGSVGATGTNSLGTVANAGSFTVAGGSTSGNSLANTGSFNVTGGAATFGAVINDGTLGVANGGTFTATSLAANTGSNIVSSGTGGSLAVTGDYQQNGGTLSGTFVNLGLTSAGALNFSSSLTASGSLGLSAASTLTLAGSGAIYSGGSVGLSASDVVVDSATVSAGNNLGISAGNLSVVGTSAPAKLIAANNIGISAGNVVVDGGSFGASIDPILLDLTLSGDLTLTGGAGTGAPAELLGDNVNVSANIITLTNGGTGSGATIVASTGNLAMNYVSCNGCTVFPAQPTTAEIGLFGQTVMLNGTLVSTSTVGSAGTVSGETSGIEQLIVGTDLAESGAIESQEVAAGGALDDDDDETDDASGDGGNINEQEQKNGVPICS